MSTQNTEDLQNEIGKLLSFKLYGIEEKFQIRYSPEAAFQQKDKLTVRSDSSSSVIDRDDALIDFLASTIVWWNMEQEENEPMPITSDNIKELPFSLVVEIGKAIAGDLQKLQ
jgi:hypothetical protein